MSSFDSTRLIVIEEIEGYIRLGTTNLYMSHYKVNIVLVCKSISMAETYMRKAQPVKSNRWLGRWDCIVSILDWNILWSVGRNPSEKRSLWGQVTPSSVSLERIRTGTLLTPPCHTRWSHISSPALAPH